MKILLKGCALCRAQRISYSPYYMSVGAVCALVFSATYIHFTRASGKDGKFDYDSLSAMRPRAYTCTHTHIICQCAPNGGGRFRELLAGIRLCARCDKYMVCADTHTHAHSDHVEGEFPVAQLELWLSPSDRRAATARSNFGGGGGCGSRSRRTRTSNQQKKPLDTYVSCFPL